MANVWFTSDLHFGHKNIQKFRLEIDSIEQNEQRITLDWFSKVTKRDDVYILGDAAFTMDSLNLFSNLPGRKFLVRGNHDELDTQVYLKYFNDIYGLKKYKEFWLSHAPIHPNELRGKINLHGHVHYTSIDDDRYVNMSVENLWKMGYKSLISLDEVRTLIKDRQI
jgi:calcineurin-like phosphoesterase family protein